MTEITPSKLANLADKLATASKTLADADKSRADAEKVRADAEKVRADSDSVRADTEKDRRLAQNALDAADADLDAKRIANDKARADNEVARVDKLIEQLTGAVPDLSSLSKSTVTFGEGKTLRQAESNARALSSIAAGIASQVREGLNPRKKTSDSGGKQEEETEGSEGPAVTIFVTSETQLVASITSYWQLLEEAQVTINRLTEATSRANQLLGPEPRRIAYAIAPGAATVAAAVAGKAITQVASLFELDVAVTTSDGDIPATAVHAAVIRELLRKPAAGTPGVGTTVRIQHQWARVPQESSALRAKVTSLIGADIDAAKATARIDQRVDGYDDVAKRLAAAHKAADDEAKASDLREQAKTDAEDAAKELRLLARLEEAQGSLAGAVAKAKAFADRITAVSDKTGTSPLMAAYAVEPLGASPNDWFVLVLDAAKVESYQMVVKRRVFAPRVQISTSVTVEFFLLNKDGVVAAGRPTASAAFVAKIARKGAAKWKSLDTFGDPTLIS